MPSPTAWSVDSLLRAELTRDLGLPTAPDTDRLGGLVAEAFGPTTTAILHYGSYALGLPTTPDSARDFFVVVEDYRDGYRALTHRIATRFGPRRASLLNRILPPNVIALSDSAVPVPLRAKCAVLSRRDLARACSGRAKDHFMLGRLFQPLRLVRFRDAASRDAVIEAIVAARTRTIDWVRCHLPERFDADTLGRTLLEVSYAAEIRPESGHRARVVFEAQRATLVPMCEALLERLADTGQLERGRSGYRLERRPGAIERLRWRAYFASSKLRATLRWFKYVALYEGWLEYVVHKLERGSGTPVRLSRLEQRWPLLFLWPRALRFLLTRPERRRGT